MRRCAVHAVLDQPRLPVRAHEAELAELAGAGEVSFHQDARAGKLELLEAEFGSAAADQSLDGEAEQAGGDVVGLDADAALVDEQDGVEAALEEHLEMLPALDQSALQHLARGHVARKKDRAAAPRGIEEHIVLQATLAPGDEAHPGKIHALAGESAAHMRGGLGIELQHVAADEVSGGHGGA